MLLGDRVDRSGPRSPPIFLLIGLALILVGLALPLPVQAQNEPADVYVIDISGEIDLGLPAYLGRVLATADAANAEAVILEINTPGGRLDAALQMRDAILGAETRTIAFVNREAFSAGALIAIAADEIYMVPGGVIGAATPVDGAGNTADAKTISAVRSTFRATAQATGRDPRVAEAMVDPAIAIDGLVAEGELLTLTTSEAEEWGYTTGVVENRDELLDAAGLASARLETTSPRLAENLVRFLTTPAVASLLVTFGFLLIFADVFSGGIGVLAAVGVALFALFFWGHFLAGLAGWESVALVLVGLALIGAEIFLIPGFGIAGILGAAALLGGVFLAVLGEQLVTPQALTRAVYTVTSVFVMMIIGAILLIRTLPRMGHLQGLILQSQVGLPGGTTVMARRRRWEWLEGPRLQSQTTPSDQERPSLRGARGVAISDLRPGGFARIDGERVDVVSEGDYIPADSPIVVIADEGYRRVVRRAELMPEEPAERSLDQHSSGG